LRRRIDRQELPQEDRAGLTGPVHMVGLGVDSIRSGSNLCSGTGAHDQQAPQDPHRDFPLPRPIYLAGRRPATDPHGWQRGSSPRHPQDSLGLAINDPCPGPSSSWCYTTAIHDIARRGYRIFAGRTSACGTVSLFQLKRMVVGNQTCFALNSESGASHVTLRRPFAISSLSTLMNWRLGRCSLRDGVLDWFWPWV